MTELVGAGPAKANTIARRHSTRSTMGADKFVKQALIALIQYAFAKFDEASSSLSYAGAIGRSREISITPPLEIGCLRQSFSRRKVPESEPITLADPRFHRGSYVGRD